MLQQSEGDDYVVASGITHSVAEFAKTALKIAGLNGELEKYIEFDETMVRPAEVDLLVGNATKIKQKLGWEPKVKFQELVEIMVKNDLKRESIID